MCSRACQCTGRPKLPSISKPAAVHPSLPRNQLGLTPRDYEGVMSTLCAGCGHDSVTAALVQAMWEVAVPPHRAAKMSGIGCSSKTTAYFMKQSHGFNSVHGRMPSVTLGATFVARGFSGDKAQLIPILKAGLSHNGLALVDVISPCVTFNDHEGSTKSYAFTREHEVEIAAADFVPLRREITMPASNTAARGGQI